MPNIVYTALWLFIFSIPWENVFVISGFGTFSRMMGIVAIGAFLSHVLLTGYVKCHKMHLWGVLFTLVAILSLFWSIQPDLTDLRVKTYVQLLVMTLLMFNVANQEERVFGLMSAYVLGCYITTFSTIYDYISGIEVAYQRYAGSGLDPNDLAFGISLAIPLAWYLSLHAKNMLNRWVYRLYPLFALYGIFLTASRGGIIGAVCGLVFIIFSTRRLVWPTRVAILLFMVVGIGLLTSFVPETSWGRLATITEEVSSGTLNDRTQIWDAGFTVFKEDPVLGIGAGAFRRAIATAIGTTTAPHNVFLSIAVDMGIVGLLLYLGIWGNCLVNVLRMQGAERTLWLIILGILLLACLTLNWEWRKVSWFLLALAISHAAVRKNKNMELVTK